MEGLYMLADAALRNTDDEHQKCHCNERNPSQERPLLLTQSLNNSWLSNYYAAMYKYKDKEKNKQTNKLYLPKIMKV